MSRRIWLMALVAAALGSASEAAPPRGRDPLTADSIRVVTLKRFEFETPTADDPLLTPEELSGITWIGGDDYLAIGDAHAVVHRLTIRLDPKSGAIRSARLRTPLPLLGADGSRIPEPSEAEDREAIAYDPERRELWIADEQAGSDRRSPSITGYRLDDGRMSRRICCDEDPILRVYLQSRNNKSFESLARSEDGTIWTANEDGLRIDGPAAGDTSGTVVRLQRFDAGLRPLGQFAYPLDPYAGRIRHPAFLSGKEISGVSEMVALPRGRLLVLERSLGGGLRGNASLRTRLYLVDPRGATDLSGIEFRSGLTGRAYVPAAKSLIWQKEWGLTNSNFEGMTLGPSLPDGSRMLILIADNNSGPSQALLPLRLSAPTPR